LPVAEGRMRALYRLGRPDKAAEVGRAMLDHPSGSADDRAVLARIAALLERIRLDRGEPEGAVRRRAIRALVDDPANVELLRLVRDTHGRLSPDARHLRLLLHGRCEAATGDGDGYYVSYRVVADDEREAAGFVAEIEALVTGCDELQVEECEALEPAAADAKGVYWYGGRVYYTE
ncbi:MAG TPA: hypothetical protein VD788_16930, partial [Candidatus Polarisedimenticolaceae bacterium]|nr:hypothetical protein [Candidatus Polarisedimenticolaceae bacterium]